MKGTTTFKFHDGRPSIQAIGNWFSDSPSNLLDKFDFTSNLISMLYYFDKLIFSF